jgi:hypothetical protein
LVATFIPFTITQRDTINLVITLLTLHILILDYESSDSKYPIATYKLDYDKGRVIVIGLPSEDIISDPCSTSCQKFIKFFDDLLSDYAM